MRTLAILATLICGCTTDATDATNTGHAPDAAKKDAMMAPETTSHTTPDGLHYEVTGSGPPLVLLHGFTLNSDMWKDQVDHFADRFEVFALNSRGTFPSVGITAAFEMQADVIAVLDDAGADAVHIVGMSMGGRTAAEVTLLHPGRVLSLTLVDALNSSQTNGVGERVGGYIGTAMTEGLEAGLTAWSQDQILDSVTDEERQAVLAMMLAGQLPHETECMFLSSHLALPAPPVADELDTIDVPTLVIVGAKDTEFLTHAQHYADNIAGAQHVVIPNAGHGANFEEPEAVNAAMDAFLL